MSKTITVEECCTILDSQRIPITASQQTAGMYPYYGANGVQDYVSDYIFDDELVLLAEDGGNFGSTEKPIAYRVSGKCWVNNHAHVLKPKQGTDVDYLCYALMFYDVSGIINGATRQKLTQAAMRKMAIPLLSLTEQCRIATVLDKTSMLIAERKRQQEQLDLIVKSRFVEMFGELRSDAIELKDICSIITDGTHQPPKFHGNGIPFLFVSNIVDNILDYTTEKFITREDYEVLIKRTPIEVGDILLTTVGSYGNPAIVRSEQEFCFQRHIAYLKPKREIVNSVFLHAALLSDDVKGQIERKVKGIAQKTLNLSELKTISVFVPPLPRQNRFADFVRQADKSKFEIQQGLKQLELQYSALMQNYFG